MLAVLGRGGAVAGLPPSNGLGRYSSSALAFSGHAPSNLVRKLFLTPTLLQTGPPQPMIGRIPSQPFRPVAICVRHPFSNGLDRFRHLIEFLQLAHRGDPLP